MWRTFSRYLSSERKSMWTKKMKMFYDAGCKWKHCFVFEPFPDLEKTGLSVGGGILQKKKNGNYLVFLALYRKCSLNVVLLLKKKVWICCLTLGWQFWKSPECTTMDSWRDAILVTLSVWNWLMFATHFQRGPFVPPWCARFKLFLN